jgi:hypothetical protein
MVHICLLMNKNMKRQQGNRGLRALACPAGQENAYARGSHPMIDTCDRYTCDTELLVLSLRCDLSQIAALNGQPRDQKCMHRRLRVHI